MDSLREKQLPLEALMPLMEEALAAGGSVRFSPKGTSMLPFLRQGIDQVVLSPLPEQLRKYDLPLYRRDNGQYVLHRIVGVGDTYTCVGDNQFELEHGVRGDQMIALVTSVIRPRGTTKMTGFAQKLYIRLWHYSRPLRRVVRGGKSALRRLIK